MRYIVDDEVVVDISISTDSPKVDVDVMTGEQVTCDTELVVAGTSLSTDLIIEETKVDDIAVTTPYSIISNEETPVVTPLQVLDYGSSSIEVSFEATTERAEEVVKGVLCGTTNPPTFENADYRLLHGQGSMDLAFAGLNVNTEYYLRPYALSNLGYKYGDIVAQRTKASPIPEEYQLVEYLQSTGTQFINTGFIPTTNNVRMDIKFDFIGIATQSISGSQKTANSRFLYIRQNSTTTAKFSSGNVTIDNGITFTVINGITTATISGSTNIEKFGINGVEMNSGGSIIGCDPLILFAKSHYGQIIEMSSALLYHCLLSDNNVIQRNLYPVYRKADNKSGMYDIVNNIFYTNQGSGEFTVGPDKEWEE